MRKTALLAALPLLLIGACGGDGSKDDDSDTNEAAAIDWAIDQYGFGQEDQHVAALALVTNQDDHAGHTVRVAVNFLDEAGEILASSNQVDHFGRVGETIAVHVFAELDNRGDQVASIEPTLIVDDDGAFETTDVELDPIEDLSIRKNDYGGNEVAYEVANPTEETIDDWAVGIVCYDESGEIVGGQSDYPGPIPGSSKTRVVSPVTVDDSAAACTAHPQIIGY